MSRRYGISMLVTLCIVLLLGSAQSADLQCCICGFVSQNGTGREHCNCHSGPEHRNCTGDVVEEVFKSNAISEQLAGAVLLKQDTGKQEERELCFAATIYSHKHEAYVFSRFTMPASFPAGEICDWQLFNHYSKSDDATLKSLCGCNADWCNCNPVEKSFILIPSPPRPGKRPPGPGDGNELETNCGSYIGIQLFLTALLIVRLAIF